MRFAPSILSAFYSGHERAFMLIDFVHLVRCGQTRVIEFRTKFHLPCLFDGDIFSHWRAEERPPSQARSQSPISRTPKRLTAKRQGLITQRNFRLFRDWAEPFVDGDTRFQRTL